MKAEDIEQKLIVRIRRLLHVHPDSEAFIREQFGQLLDGDEAPVSDGVVEVFEPSSRRWGRCGTDADGRFSFVVPDAPHLESYLFARGLLRHQLTRIELSEARQEDGALRFDIRLQGERQTVFFDV